MQWELFADAATSPAQRVPCLWKEQEKKQHFYNLHRPEVEFTIHVSLMILTDDRPMPGI